ncbi:MAG: LodA/GoxA family CTQ-dependent oxidase, partial [Candidatus Dormibacteraceae bacterium]
MVQPDYHFRVHPVIGIARVGNSEEYYLGPETMAGMPSPTNPTITGGLPIRNGTESDPITSGDLRDRSGALKRQAARFRIFAYPQEKEESYPAGTGQEIRIGTTVSGKKVRDIIWTVHLANKKANSYVLNDSLGLHLYEPEHKKQRILRNRVEGADPNDERRLRRMVIDAGPRAISGANTGPVRFDNKTPASSGRPGGHVVELGNYPMSFPVPGKAFKDLYMP